LNHRRGLLPHSAALHAGYGRMEPVKTYRTRVENGMVVIEA
jgi:hypothetical protein